MNLKPVFVGIAILAFSFYFVDLVSVFFITPKRWELVNTDLILLTIALIGFI